MTKTAGDFGVEIEKSMINNSLSGVPPITAEMRAAAPPVEPPAPAEPVDQGLTAYADQLDAAVAANNVAQARAIAEEMIKVAPPTPPPTEPPVEPPVEPAPPPPSA